MIPRGQQQILGMLAKLPVSQDYVPAIVHEAPEVVLYEEINSEV